MQEWIHKHKRGLSIGLGIVLILIALGMVFWDNTGTPVVSEEEAYAQKVEAMEARMSGGTVSPSKKAEESPIMKAYREKQAEHLRYTLIVIIIAGIGFLIYGLISKKRE
ncbi:hypothetical protein [Sulfuricurvum sp.]|uniref:hypothetical protein n=1 Tax=Sulfuricurvum sp. TaxID=2025608 RepID=UPI00261EBB9A|nr:hypothetical protein [Sulfuricurvum sp.]MDD4883739.1 hypothetical protein [Sulfuricurvum sp.]